MDTGEGCCENHAVGSSPTEKRVSRPKFPPEETRPRTFPNAAAQLKWYARRFILFLLWVKDENVTAADLEAVSRTVEATPDQFIIMKIMEIWETWGNKLDKDDLTALTQIATLYSQSCTAQAIIDETSAFIKKFQDDPELRQRLFSYINRLRQIIEATRKTPGN